MMTPVFSTSLKDSEQARRFVVEATVAVNSRYHTDDAIDMIKRDLAMQVAERILKCPELFTTDVTSVSTLGLVRYSLDLNFLTTKEYNDLRLESFKAGHRHATVERAYGPFE